VTSSRHIPADADLTYFTVTCHLAPIVADLSQDSDYDPNTARIDAVVTFTPKYKAGEVIHSHTSTPPTGFLALPVTALIDDGYLKLRAKPDAGAAPLPGTLHGLKAKIAADTGQEPPVENDLRAALNYAPVRLLGNSTTLEIDPEIPLYYDFTFTNIKIDGKQTNYVITGGTFEAPWEDTVIDLLDFMPLSPGPYAQPMVVGPQGPPGEPGPATVNVGTTTTSLPGSDAQVSNAGDGVNAVFDFVIPRGDVGPPGASLTEVASVADLPAGQSPGTVFLTVDTGDLYRADGTKATGWQRISQQVASTGIEDATAVGRSVVTAVDEQAARDAIVAERRRTVNVRDFGAKGDWNPATQTGTDDSAAFAAAMAAASAGGATPGMRVYVPPGNYRLTSTWVVSQTGITVEGEYSSNLYIDHLNGPGVHITVGYTSLRKLRVQCSDARKAAAFDATNIGVLVESADTTPLVYCSKTEIEDVEASDHPSHGFVIVGYQVHAVYQRLSSLRNKGHGVVIDGGEITNRVNVSDPGICTVKHGWAFNNGGHGLLVGNPNGQTTPFRVLIDNFEATNNSLNSAVRFTPDEAWVFGENCEIRQSAFGPSTMDATRYGVRVAGRGWFVRNIRSVNLGRAVTLSGDTIDGTGSYANTVEHVRVFGTPQAVGVVLEAGVFAARVDLPMPTNMTVPVQDNASKDGGNMVSTMPQQFTPPNVLAATQNDYDWGLGKRTIRLNAPVGGATITGFAHPSSGRQFRIINASANTITLSNGNTASSFFNRITTHTGADFVLKINESVLMEYDANLSRWRTLANVPAGFSPLGHTHVAGDVVGAEATINKNVANGYPGLDANARIQAAQLPLGASRLVCTTLTGSNAAENGAGTWTKLATIDPAASTNTDANLTLAVNSNQSSAHSSAILSVYVRANATGNPTADVQLVSRTGSAQIAADSFKLINNGAGTPVELWMRKSANFGQFAVWELARVVNPSITVTYSTAPGWQSATPTGTAVNVSSAGVTAGGNPVSTRVAVPGNAAATGLPGQWAADATAIYAYTGNGTTHTWVKSVAAAW
jgi:hypothetical protein